MADDSPEEIYQLSSREGQVFNLDRKAMEMIEPVRILFTAGGLDQVPLEVISPIRLEVSTAALRKLVEWCNHHKNDPEEGAPMGENGEIPEWDLQFFDVRYGLLFDIIRAARDYEVPSLFEMCCRIVGRNPHEIMRGLIHRDEEEIEIIRASFAAA